MKVPPLVGVLHPKLSRKNETTFGGILLDSLHVRRLFRLPAFLGLIFGVWLKWWRWRTHSEQMIGSHNIPVSAARVLDLGFLFGFQMLHSSLFNHNC